MRELGATYHTGAIADIGVSPDIVVECTGVPDLVRQSAESASPGGIVCLTGVGDPNASGTSSAAGLATQAVLKNLVMFGTVNANRRHYYHAAKVLATGQALVARAIDNAAGVAGPRRTGPGAGA